MEMQQKDGLSPMVEALECVLGDTQQVGRHAYRIMMSLSRARCWDSLAISMLALGHDKQDVLEAIKAWHIRHGMDVSAFWEAITEANLDVDSERVVAALSEVCEACKRPSMHEDISI